MKAGHQDKSIDGAEHTSKPAPRTELLESPAVRLVRDGVTGTPTAPENAGQDTAPPDVESARVIAKVRWLMLGVMLFTFMSVAGVIGVIGFRVYGSAAILDRPFETTLALPNRAKIIQTAIAEGRIFVTIELNGAVEIRSFDIKTLQPLGRLNFSNGQ